MERYRLLEQLSSGHSCDTYDAWSEERGCRVIVRTGDGGIATAATDVWGIAAVLRWAGLDLELPEDPAERPSVGELLGRLG